MVNIVGVLRMNDPDAVKVIRILLSADGGCPFCASALLFKFIETYPEFEQLAHRMFNEKNPDEDLNAYKNQIP